MAVAAVAGVVAVIIMALVFFMGGGNAGGNSGVQTAPVQSTTVQAIQTTFGSSVTTTTASVVSINPELIKEAPIVTVPDNGAFVRVNYIGGFAGTYGINGEIMTVRNSGERVFPLNASTGAVSATFHKEDGSTRHEIVVEIYKNGKVLKSARNTSAYGEVSVNSPV